LKIGHARNDGSARGWTRRRSDGSLRAGWVKLGRRTPGLFVLDRIGWQPISQPA